MRRIVKNPIVGAYVLIVAAGSVGFARAETQSHDLCVESRRTWAAGETIVNTLTAHTNTSPALSRQAADILTAFKAQIALANQKRDAQRLSLNAELGPKPSC